MEKTVEEEIADLSAEQDKIYYKALMNVETAFYDLERELAGAASAVLELMKIVREIQAAKVEYPGISDKFLKRGAK